MHDESNSQMKKTVEEETSGLVETVVVVAEDLADLKNITFPFRLDGF